MSRKELTEYEASAETENRIKLFDTGGGYLVFRVRREYFPENDRWFPVEHRLIGVANVDDWFAVDSTLQKFGLGEIHVRYLPEFTIDEEEEMPRSDSTEGLGGVSDSRPD